MKTVKYICESCQTLISVKEDIKLCPNCGCKLYKRNLITNKTKIKDKAWQQFSKYIRLRDCIKTTGSNTSGVCYTCGSTYDIANLQAGHMVDGRSNKVLFDERFVNAQCYRCNMHKSGKQGLFVINKISELSSELNTTIEEAFDIVKEHFNKDNQTLSVEELVEIYFKFKNKVDNMNFSERW